MKIFLKIEKKTSSSTKSPPWSEFYLSSVCTSNIQSRGAKRGRIGAVSGIISRPALGPFVALAAIGLGSANGRRAVHLFRLNNQKSQAQRAVFIENSRIYDENARIYITFHEQRKQRNSRTFHLKNLLGHSTQKARKRRKTRFSSKNHKI